MTSLRKYSLAAGIFYMLTFVSIPTLSLYKAVRAGSGGPIPLHVLLCAKLYPSD